MRLHTYITLIFLIAIGQLIHATNPYIPASVSITSGNYYSIFIMDQGKTSVDELAAMLQFYNPKINDHFANEIALIYIEECMDEGVNHDIAFCQMILETGFLKFGGDVLKSQNNFCGLGATGKNVRGERFPDMRIGIRAHVQHLKAYASAENLNKDSVDKRFRFVKRGSATTIYALPGKWAADRLYDKKLENLLQRLFNHRYFFADNLTLDNIHQ